MPNDALPELPVQSDALDAPVGWLEEASAPANATPVANWRILVIDDDEQVHAATRFALAGVSLLNRPLELVHANSASNAREILATRRDFAVILLDVVMETTDAGLKLVSQIRNEFGMRDARIILRTGQPGYAPELAVFTDYDINDYRTKAELTRTRLITALIAALRGFDQLQTIATNRRGLELIVRAVSDLTERHALSRFAEGVLTQLTDLLRIPLDGIVCAQRGSPWEEHDAEGLFIVGAAGRRAHMIAAPLDDLHDEEVRLAIEKVILSQRHEFGDHTTTLYLSSGEQSGAIFLDTRQPLSEGERQLVEVFAANISSCFGNVKQLEKLNYAAWHDALTNLHNRAWFVMLLNTDMRQNEADQALALIDIEHFTDVNDGLGQEIGNALLLAVARRLEKLFVPQCHLARIGADVFGLIGSRERLDPALINHAFSQPFTVGEHALPISVALGLYSTGNQEEDGYTVLRRASIALNHAKRSPTSSAVWFTPEMENNTRWRLDVLRDLRTDFRDGKLEVWYQPQIAMATGKVCGAEALLRWPGATLFVQPPSVFVPLAEYSGLIVEIGEWVLHEAGTTWRDISQLRSSLTHIAVNLSLSQFRNGHLAETIALILGEERMPPSALELEITESVAMEEPRHVIASLKALREMGVRIAIDDFGTGYSSLGQLKSLPIDSLKIDRSFIAEIANGQGGSFAETIIALAHKTGLQTIAEGVETAEQAGFLRALGCTQAQGFYYAKPMPKSALLEWLAAQPV